MPRPVEQTYVFVFSYAAGLPVLFLNERDDLFVLCT